MLILETTYLIVSSLLLYPLGRVFFRNLDFVVQLFIGLMISGILLSFTARFIPAYSREILALISFLSIVLCIKDFKLATSISISVLKDFIKPKIGNFFKFFLIFIVFNYLLRDFSPIFFQFESHDVHIFGPTIEIFNATYLGNIKNPILFPLELSAYHILPGTYLGAANFLNPSIDLITLINAKYILVCLFFSYAFFKVLEYSNFSFISVAIGAALLFFFKETIGYNISISSYLYQLVLIFIAIVFFELDTIPNSRLHKEAIIALLMMLLCVKIPIFYAIIPSLLYLFYKDPKCFFRLRLLSLGILCFLSLLAIALTPQSPEIAKITQYSVINIFNYESLSTLAGLWFVENRFLELFSFLNSYFINFEIFNKNFSEYLNLFIKMLYILIFYFGLFFFAIKSFQSSASKQALKIYLVSAILGWLFIRNNGNLDQQNHLFFNISILSLILFFRATSSLQKISIFNAKIGLLGFIFIFVLTDSKNFTEFKLSGDSINYRENNSITLTEFQNLPVTIVGDRLLIDPETPFWKSALLSQMNGKRIYHEDLIKNDISFESYHLSQYRIN